MGTSNRCTTKMNNAYCNDTTIESHSRRQRLATTTTRTSRTSTDTTGSIAMSYQQTRSNNSFYLPIIVLSIIMMNHIIRYPTCIIVTSFQIQSLSSYRMPPKLSSVVGVVRRQQQQSPQLLHQLSSSRIDISILDKPVISLTKLLNNDKPPMTPIVSFISLVQDCIQSLLFRSNGRNVSILSSASTILVSFFIILTFWKLVRKYILPITTSILQSIVSTFTNQNDPPIPMKFDSYDTYTSTTITAIGSEDEESDSTGTNASSTNGWGYGTIKSVKSYTDLTNICTIQLPKRNMYIPTNIGQPITICTMIETNDHDTDFSSLKNNNNNNNENDTNSSNKSNDIITTCTDIYPFNLYSTTNIPKGLVSFLIPQQYLENNDNEDNNTNNRYNLQNTIHIGDTVALRPSSNGSKVVLKRIQDQKPIAEGISTTTSVSLVKQQLQLQQQQHHHLPATVLLKECKKVVYVVIGVAGIAPVLDQISFILSSENDNDNDTNDDEEEESSSSSLSSTVQKKQITILWICNNDDEFDNSITDHLEELYSMYPNNLFISCIVDDTITTSDNNDNRLEYYRNNDDIQESIEQQMYENHHDHVHTTPTPTTSANSSEIYSSLAIISVTSDYYNPQKTSTIINTATTFLVKDRQFPLECIITM